MEEREWGVAFGHFAAEGGLWDVFGEKSVLSELNIMMDESCGL